METIEKYKKRVSKMSVNAIRRELENILDPDSDGFARMIHLDGDDYMDLRILKSELDSRGLEFPFNPYRKPHNTD